MSARAQLSQWASPVLFSCLAVISACGSSDGSTSGTGGASNLAGAANGGSPSAGASGSSVAGAATAGSPSGGSAGAVAGSPGAGAPAGGDSAVAGAAGSGGAAAGAGGASGGASSGGGAGTGSFTLTSPGWTSQASCAPDNKTGCGVFPKENIGTNISGSNKSPELDWGAGPSATQSYAIVL
ncbi:MAG: hypothetical protein ABW061_17845, partial [Polyangiaceae bacterium]